LTASTARSAQAESAVPGTPAEVSLNAHRQPTRIRSVTRAIKVLQLIAEHGEGVTASFVRDALGLSAPTMHHLLQTLVDEEVLVKDSNRRYSLGPAVGALADSFLRRVRPPEYLLEPVRDLARVTGETAYVSGWRADEIVVLASFEGSNAVRVSGLHSGSQGCGHARASGKILLAYAAADVRAQYLNSRALVRLTPNTITNHEALEKELDCVRLQGFAEDREEFRVGVSCLSVPVRGRLGIIGAFTVSAPSRRYDEMRDQYLLQMREAVRKAVAGANEPKAPQ
jgi:IclR family acetate operon transcriptional repressor